jgi:histidine decarboxylase
MSTPLQQISVVSEARPNVIAELIEALAASEINIETLDSQTFGGTVVAILTVDCYDDALRALAVAGFPAVGEDALLVRVDDRPGALATLARRFHQANIPLHSVRIVRRAEGWGVVALSTPRTEEALALVRDELIA